MFNWTTTNLINEIPSYDNSKEGKLRLGKYLFEKRWVESIRKAVGAKEVICEASLDFTAVKTALDAAKAKFARLYIYVGLEGSDESTYANAVNTKGLPLSVSFANATAKEMVDEIIDIVNRFNVFTKHNKILEVSAKEGTDTTLVIKGTHEYQRLKMIKVLVDDGTGFEVPVINYEAGRKEDSAVTDIVIGVNGFGTYSHLIKDLRLPTPINTHWNAANKNEMPAVGSIYTQFIINYCAPSNSNPSFTAVGNRSLSATTHVFWVKSELVNDFATLLAAIDPDGGTLDTKVVVKDKIFNNTKGSILDRVEELEGK
jgi:hypothetical protein